jgi:hypothetical protein
MFDGVVDQLVNHQGHGIADSRVSAQASCSLAHIGPQLPQDVS